jgi:hypothetical protein
MINRLYPLTVLGKQRIFDGKARTEDFKFSSEQSEEIISMKSVFRYLTEKFWKMDVIDKKVINLKWKELPDIKLKKMQIIVNKKL